MRFVGHLCLALGRTLGEVLALSAAEFAFWELYYQRNGFPADRAEAAVALSGEALAKTWGAKVEVKDLIPRFGQRRTDPKLLAAQLAALPGAKVVRREKAKPKAG